MTMWKTLWSIGIVAVVGATLLMTPATSEAQRRGGRGWDGGRGWSGRGWDGGWRWGGVNVGVGVGYPAYYGGGYYRGYYPYYNTYDYSYPVYSDQFSPQYSYSSNSLSDTQYSFYPSSQNPGPMQYGLMNPNDAGFIVRVPDPNAEVYFQDFKTQQRGVVRHFETDKPLDPNQAYTFQIRARWTQNGQPVEQTRQVQARAGQNVTVDFANANNQRFQNRPLPKQQVPNQQLQNNQQPNQVTPNQQAPNRQTPNERIPQQPAKNQPGQESPTNEP
jgi:uncharacterized protein (TIGR03000 family)